MDYKWLSIWTRERLRRIPFIFWMYRIYVIKKGQLYLHPNHLNWGKTHADSVSKPVLAYVEMHLATHCNIKCKGCSQFSPIADIWFADISQHEKDMIQLKSLFSSVETIRLIGGEPLLNPDIEKFIYITRKYFRNSNICIATNGSAFHAMSESFWESCRINHIKINWTVYPPFSHLQSEYINKIESKGIIINSRKFDRFRSVLNIKGDSDPDKAISFCRSLYFCPFLREGKLYMCSRPVVIKYFNNKFGTDIPSGGYIDIHDPKINGWDVLISLAKSTETCRYCATKLNYFEWTDTKYVADEWCVE